MTAQRHLMQTLVPLCTVLAMTTATSSAFAQDTPAPSEEEKQKLQEQLSELENIEQLLAFMETWEGTPDELQSAYEGLSPDKRQLIDSNFEFSSIEGGIGLMGGFESPLSGDSEGRGLFRLSTSLGLVWPVGDYALPIYYAVTDIPGPWAIGFQGFAQVDNFDTFSGGATLRLASQYIGTTASLEIGPAFRAGSDVDGAAGLHMEVGYGNILFQGMIQSEIWFSGDLPLTILAGVRIPWLLWTLL